MTRRATALGWLSLVACLAQTAPARQPEEDLPVAAVPPSYHAAVSDLDQWRLAARVPAMAVVLLNEGRPVLVEAFGNASPDTPFRWGSITKTFTALAALALTDGPVLNLSTPVRDVLGAGYFSNPWAATRPLRLVHLLTLSGGFADLSRAEWEYNEPLDLWTALNRYAPERLVRWPPGLQHSYSNAPPGLTAAVIERVSGTSFERHLAESVLEPLGMSAAALEPVAGLPGGFRSDGVTEIPYWHMTYRAFGALNASAREMSGFLTALLNDGRLPGLPGLPAARVRALLAPAGTLGSAAGLEVGYGIGAYGWVRHGHLFHGHGGDADGYRSRYGVLADHGRGYALVINTDNPRLLERMCRRLESALTGDLAPHPRLTRVSSDLTRYAGDYLPSSSRFDRPRPASRAQVRVSGAALTFHHRGRNVVLHPVGEDRFAREGDPAVTVVFVRDGHGSLFMQGEFGNFASLSRGPCPDFLDPCE